MIPWNSLAFFVSGGVWSPVRVHFTQLPVAFNFIMFFLTFVVCPLTFPPISEADSSPAPPHPNSSPTSPKTIKIRVSFYNSHSKTKKRDNSTESSRLVSLLNVFPMGRIMGPSWVSGITSSYHGVGGIWMTLEVG